MNCPSCAAELPPASRFALLTVCPYCVSAIVLDEEAARIAGKMSSIAAPRGPLSVGARGSVGKHAFTVLGRVRYGYPRGFWDEWFLQLDSGGTAWISEDGDDFALETLAADVAVQKQFSEIRPGDRLELRGKTWHVDEIDTARCEGGEGELPFVVLSGEEVPFVELSGNGRFATIEYEEDGTRVFFGRRLNPRRITIDAGGGSTSSLADEGSEIAAWRKRVVKTEGRSKALRCESCGAPVAPSRLDGSELDCASCGKRIDLSLHRVDCPHCQAVVTYRNDEAAATTCTSCHSQIDLLGEEPSVYGALYDPDRPRQFVQLGDAFTFRDTEYRVSGFVQSAMYEEGVRYPTDEWLLYSPEVGYRWLSCEAGHWSFSRELTDRPGSGFDPRNTKRKKSFTFREQRWRVFEVCNQWKIEWVEGELDWVARIGDVSGYMDATRPPYLLSATWTESEMEWYLGEYLSTDTVAEALGTLPSRLPRPKGVAPHQPWLESPQSRQMRIVTSLFAALFLLLGVVQCSDRGTIVADYRLTHEQYREPYLTEPFVISQGETTCVTEFEATVSNSWCYLDVALVNEREEALFDYSTEISYYWGRSGGESWSEGSQRDSQLFRVQDPGSYRLLLRGEFGDTGAAPELRIRIREGVGVARYYIFLGVLCSLWLLIWILRRFSHEAKRWED